VKDPFGKESGQTALKIGQFVSARIQGRSIENVFVIPNKSIREGSYVYTVRDGKLAKQSIKILWQDDKNALIGEGILDGELIVTTSLNSTLAGASAKFGDDATQSAAAVPTEQVQAAVEETAVAQTEETDTLNDDAATTELISEAIEATELPTETEDNSDKVIEAVDLPDGNGKVKQDYSEPKLEADTAQATESTPSE
jgi:NADH dehydrogenase/NADH:ubiquinone oxidoreductase subunit G